MSHPSRFLPFLFSSFLILFPLSPACAQSNTARLKLVFPFGNLKTQSVCPLPNRTLDGCCEPPHSLYTYDKKTGCCRLPHSLETVGTNTRCCRSLTGNETRWGQTEQSPCGSACQLPMSVLDFGGTSSCCSSLPAGQNRWGRTSSSVCGGYCAPGNTVSSYQTFSSCCPTCSEVTAFQSVGHVCGTCCSRIPESCGSAGYRVCESATGSAYCSSDITKCTPPTDWVTGTSGEGGYSCCASCAGTRYGHTTSSCGSCCTGANQLLTYGGQSSCCPDEPVGYTRWSKTAGNVCGQFCSTPDFVSLGAESSCCPTCNGSRYAQSALNICGDCCSTGSSVVLAPGATYTSCCRAGQAYSLVGNSTACTGCSIGETGTFTVDARGHCANCWAIPVYFKAGTYKIATEWGCWRWGNGHPWQAQWWRGPVAGGCGTLGLPQVYTGEIFDYNTCVNQHYYVKNSIVVSFAVPTMHYFGVTDDNCGDNGGNVTYRWTCID